MQSSRTSSESERSWPICSHLQTTEEIGSALPKRLCAPTSAPAAPAQPRHRMRQARPHDPCPPDGAARTPQPPHPPPHPTRWSEVIEGKLGGCGAPACSWWAEAGQRSGRGHMQGLLRACWRPGAWKQEPVAGPCPEHPGRRVGAAAGAMAALRGGAGQPVGSGPPATSRRSKLGIKDGASGTGRCIIRMNSRFCNTVMCGH